MHHSRCLSAIAEKDPEASLYAAHDVDEVLIVDRQERSVSWLALEDGEYRPVEHSGLLDLGAQGLAEQLDWPAIKPA